MSENRVRAADIEIVERYRGKDPAANGPCVVVPSEIRVNGMPLMVTKEGPKIEKIDLMDDVVLVTMTVFARRVTIGTEEILELEPATEARQS